MRRTSTEGVGDCRKQMLENRNFFNLAFFTSTETLLCRALIDFLFLDRPRWSRFRPPPPPPPFRARSYMCENASMPQLCRRCLRPHGAAPRHGRDIRGRDGPCRFKHQRRRQRWQRRRHPRYHGTPLRAGQRGNLARGTDWTRNIAECRRRCWGSQTRRLHPRLAEANQRGATRSPER